MPNGRYANKLRDGHRTNIEATVEQWLMSQGVEYLFEEHIGRFAVDFLLPTLGLAIDCDGAYWHTNRPAQADRDRRKAAAVTAAGYQFVRLPEATIHDKSFVAQLAPLIAARMRSSGNSGPGSER